MLTRKMENKIEELKCFFNSKLQQQEETLTKIFHALIADLKKGISQEIQKEVTKQCRELETENKMLKKSVSELVKLNIQNQKNTEELDQYGRRLCLRIDGVSTVNNESSDTVLEYIKPLFTEANVNIPDLVVDRAHRIGPVYTDRVSKNKCKSIIVRFTTFRHRTMFYRARRNLKNRVRVKLDLTKSRYNLLKKANYDVEIIPTISFCYADVNCRLKVRFEDENENNVFFSSYEELCKIVDGEI